MILLDAKQYSERHLVNPLKTQDEGGGTREGYAIQTGPLQICSLVFLTCKTIEFPAIFTNAHPLDAILVYSIHV